VPRPDVQSRQDINQPNIVMIKEQIDRLIISRSQKHWQAMLICFQMAEGWAVGQTDR
jgi:hypothetical protein